jgi:predicted DNA-binding transcriptional regulator
MIVLQITAFIAVAFVLGILAWIGYIMATTPPPQPIEAIEEAILAASLIGIILYGWLVFLWAPMIVLQITAFIAVAFVLGILAWIGYTMATTPPPQPIEAIEEAVEKESKPEAKGTEGEKKGP